MYQSAPNPKESLSFARLDEETFCALARRHGTSDEIGRIATFFDDDKKKDGKPSTKGSTLFCPPRLYGLTGCGRLGVAVCLTIHNNASDDKQSCRLDSVITDSKLRKRGLASLLIAHAFLDVLNIPDFSITTFHSHAVHPGTVRMLKRMLFSDPPINGAPLITVQMTDEIKPKFVTACDLIIQERTNNLKLHCAFCLQGNKRKVRHWCVP